MWKAYRKNTWLIGILMISFGSVSAQTSGASFEIGGTLQESYPGSGYVVVEGNRYRVDAKTTVISNEGENLPTGALAPGMKVLLRGVDNRADKIFVFPADSDFPHH